MTSERRSEFKHFEGRMVQNVQESGTCVTFRFTDGSFVEITLEEAAWGIIEEKRDHLDSCRSL